MLPTEKNIISSKNSYKKTVVYDPLKSETYRALQEDAFYGDKLQEVTTPIQQKTFHPNRLVPGKVSVNLYL